MGLVQLEHFTYDVTVDNAANTQLLPAALTVTKYQAKSDKGAFVLGAGELTSSTTTATVTHTAHGFLDGQMVTILGATQEEYNGTFKITVTGTGTFTYKFAGSATSPATTTTTISAALKSPNPLSGDLELTFTAGHVLRWLRANQVINVAGFPTTTKLNQKYRVKSVAYASNTALLYAPFIQDFTQWNTLTTEAATAAISVHAQRVIFQNRGANAITVGSNLKALGVSGYQFDMADWYGIAAAAPTTLSILAI